MSSYTVYLRLYVHLWCEQSVIGLKYNFMEIAIVCIMLAIVVLYKL